MKILFLANRPMGCAQAATVVEYLDSFQTSQNMKFLNYQCLIYSSRININRFDAIITHYSLSLGPMIDHYLGPDLKSQSSNLKD